MIERLDYKSILINKKKIVFPARIHELSVFEESKCIVLYIWPEETDEEYSDDYKFPPFRNIHCYDFEGNLKWKHPWGITGMKKTGEDMVGLYDGNDVYYVKVSTGDIIRSEYTK